MNIYYSLNRDIPIEKLAHDIQNLVSKFISINGKEDLLLCVEIKKISNDNSSLIPKIENKISDLTI
jgi:hypothetical protein